MQDSMINVLESTGSLLLDIGRFVLIAIFFFAIAHVGSKLFNAFLGSNRLLNRFGQNGEMIIKRLVSIVAYGIALIALLTRFGANTTGILALLSAFTVAIGLAFQDVAKNFISGVFMLAERPFTVGDRVRIRDQDGTVQGIDIRTTMLRTDDGSLLMVPNSMMFTEILRNESRYNMRTIQYTITTKLSVEELEIKVASITESVEGLRPTADQPVLIEYLDEAMKWRIGFAVNQKQKAPEIEISRALLKEFPDASISRVLPT